MRGISATSWTELYSSLQEFFAISGQNGTLVVESAIRKYLNETALMKEAAKKL